MFFKKSVHIDSHIDTLVGHETQIQGNMHFAGGLRVDGQIAGNLIEKREHPSTLIISENGAITGAVEASKIVLNGIIRGPVKSSVFIELQSKARIVGDLYYKSLEMHTGAVIEGKLIYLGEQPPEVAVPELT
ncbi:MULTISPECIES: polymer-forming cytoskeletal protein [unclassified Methylophilus]|jgi:cytoskeletal protein CcmA (bactofilin family)|uniref:bactofilin family protein n=1 Tax=unclassified Methylophilus TaxID=2630143 RepID=UPI0006FEAD41|nr:MULTISPECIES: polymer-forming cytoskeletal protein [unclassified Methylophilus]KQT33197.1 cell shape determination protein CcmA [Methylophilus sp. Leaf414]KQT42589.1 cell shape determination protein CcmA [Methylophilus sp. Leaf416]KQT56773.1 cell shape determination protein CcmA [Methylophilus sp. Leaf459]